MSARTRRRGWREPELDLGPTDLALVAQVYDAPTARPAPAVVVALDYDHPTTEVADHGEKTPATPRVVKSWTPTYVERATTYTVNGRRIEVGTEVTIRGERGRFRFRYLDTFPDGRRAEVTVTDPYNNGARTFYADRIATVHRITKGR